MLKRRAFALAIAAFVASSTLAFAAETPDWIKRSNEDAQPLLKVLGDFGPEFAARTGVGCRLPLAVRKVLRRGGGQRLSQGPAKDLTGSLRLPYHSEKLNDE